MYKFWRKLLIVDYIKIVEEKFDSDHSAKEKLIIISHLFHRSLSRSCVSVSKLCVVSAWKEKR